MPVRCLTIENGKIHGVPPESTLGTLEGDVMMAVDYDAIHRGKFNFKLYGEIAKFFELVIVNFPGRMEDFMDSLISGAVQVVVHPEEKEYMIDRMLEVSDAVILPSRSSMVGDFLNAGGRYLISSGEVFRSFDRCYNVGTAIPSEKYINVTGFPEDLLPYI